MYGKIIQLAIRSLWEIEMRKVEAVTDFIFLGSKITADHNCSHEIKRHLLLERKAVTNLDCVFKSRDITLLTKVCRVKAMVFSNIRVWIWELDHKEGWTLKNWCFWIVVLEKTLENPLDGKEIKSVNSKGNQPWIFIERTDSEVKPLILWPPDAKSWLFGKDPDAGKIEDKKRRGWERMRWLDNITNSIYMNLSKLRETVKDRGPWLAAVHGMAKSWTRLRNWTTVSKTKKSDEKLPSIQSFEWRSKIFFIMHCTHITQTKEKIKHFS